MSGYFEKKLIDLLPPLYAERDTTGDLRAFLSIPAATLDELKDLIDRLPDIWDVDRCDTRFLPLLAAIVGYGFDPTKDPDAQRREIRQAVEVYRRKGTIPAIRRGLVNIGWQGEIEETFRKALRLNRRARISRAKLPGELYSLGVYRIESGNVVPGLREALYPNHPAGTRIFFLQWLRSLESMEEEMTAALGRVVEIAALGRLHETFVVGRNSLNSDYRLARKQSTWSYWRITDQVMLLQDIERAGVRVSRWHGRKPGPKLNAFTLNVGRLLNVELSERRLEFTCDIETMPPTVPVVVRLAGQHLNRSQFARAERPCRVIFRQKDCAAFVRAGFTAAANLYTVTQWPS